MSAEICCRTVSMRISSPVSTFRQRPSGRLTVISLQIVGSNDRLSLSIDLLQRRGTMTARAVSPCCLR